MIDNLTMHSACRIAKYKHTVGKVWLKGCEILARSKQVSIGSGVDIPHCFFIHIPRCGGTSVEHALRKIYPKAEGLRAAASFRATQALYPKASSSEKDLYMFKLREILLLYHMSRHIPLVHGHY